ncbi:MAG: hypothetical protein HFI37_09130 [Lachnospiraceae bacterium]|nr:hypothetical protein [Lachnospiraceae bacterium]
MKLEKIITCISAVIALIAAVFLFFHFYPENLLRRSEPAVNPKDMEPGVIYTGSRAGEDIQRLSGKEEFAALTFDYDYVTVEGKEIIPTKVYSLKPWVNPYSTQRINRRATGVKRRKKDIITSALDMQEDYNQYYLLELSDSSYILAQIPPGEASAIRRGKEITLPIGRKTRLNQTAKSLLTEICNQYGVETEGVLYTFDEEWYEKHYIWVFLIRFAAAFAALFVIAVILDFAVGKIGKKIGAKYHDTI